jgi:hypothetical protein
VKENEASIGWKLDAGRQQVKHRRPFLDLKLDPEVTAKEPFTPRLMTENLIRYCLSLALAQALWLNANHNHARSRAITKLTQIATISVKTNPNNIGSNPARDVTFAP